MNEPHHLALCSPRRSHDQKRFVLDAPDGLRARISVDLFCGLPLWTIEVEALSADGWPLPREEWGASEHDVRIFALNQIRHGGFGMTVEIPRSRSALFARPLSQVERSTVLVLVARGSHHVQAAAL